MNAQKPLLPAFACELESNPTASDSNVAVLQGREAIAFILIGVVIIANSDDVVSNKWTTVASTFSRGKPPSHMFADLRPNVG
jgi:hypothetical protein